MIGLELERPIEIAGIRTVEEDCRSLIANAEHLERNRRKLVEVKARIEAESKRISELRAMIAANDAASSLAYELEKHVHALAALNEKEAECSRHIEESAARLGAICTGASA